MSGVILGLAFGGMQLYLLILAVHSLGGERVKIWPFAVQFLCPIAGLGLCAWKFRANLVACAVAMSVILIGGALVVFVRTNLRRQGKKD